MNKAFNAFMWVMAACSATMATIGACQYITTSDNKTAFVSVIFAASAFATMKMLMLNRLILENPANVLSRTWQFKTIIALQALLAAAYFGVRYFGVIE